MKTLLKILLLLVVVVVIAAIAGLAFLFTKYPDVPPADAVTVRATPEAIARGDYLSNHVTGCTICHTPRDMTKYGGPIKMDSFGAGGEFFGDQEQNFIIYSKNITPAAIGRWSDGQLIRSFTAGVNAQEQPLFPIMPYPRFAKLSREDVEAITAYIRTLKPVQYTAPERHLPLPLPLIVRTMPKPASFRPVPPTSDRVAYGEYMTNAALCAECHTPIDQQGIPLPGLDYAGGFEMKLPAGGVVRSANITPDADTGLGTWTEKDFLDKFRAWRAMEPRALTPQEQRENTWMPWIYYSGMTDEDLGAIYAYLRTLKPVINRVKKFN